MGGASSNKNEDGESAVLCAAAVDPVELLLGGLLHTGQGLPQLPPGSRQELHLLPAEVWRGARWRGVRLWHSGEERGGLDRLPFPHDPGFLAPGDLGQVLQWLTRSSLLHQWEMRLPDLDSPQREHPIGRYPLCRQRHQGQPPVRPVRPSKRELRNLQPADSTRRDSK